MSILKNCYIIKRCGCKDYLNEEQIIFIDNKFELLIQILTPETKKELLKQWGIKNKHLRSINFDRETLYKLI